MSQTEPKKPFNSNAFVVGDLESTCLSAAERDLIENPAPAGIILFKRNYFDPVQIKELCESIRQINPQLFIAVDQEGGRVQRLTAPFSRLPAMAAAGELYLSDPDDALRRAEFLGELMALEVRSVGIDFSFAPVLDVANPQSRVIGDRAFSAIPDQIIQLAGAFIRGMHHSGMPATGKHYPGHGTVAEDSHVELPVDRRSFEQIRDTDSTVFVELAASLDAIMPAHVLYPAFDDLPAGFSSKWLNWYRQNSEFRGVVFSDDLSMGGAAAYGDYTNRTEAALSAGCDYVLLCNNPVELYQLLAVAAQGRFDAWRSDNAYRRRFMKTIRQQDSNFAKGLDQIQQSERWQQLNAALELRSGY